MQITKEKFLIFFPSVLIALIPLFLITGPFLSDLCVIIVGIIFIINLYIEKNFGFLKNKFFFIFIIFFAYLLFNSVVKYYDIHNIRTSIGYLRFGIFFMGVFYFLEKKPEIIRWLFFVFLFCFSILIVDGFLQYFIKTNILNAPTMDGRISSLFGSEYIMGSYLSRVFPIFLGITIYLFRDKKNYIYLISIIFVLVEVLIFLSGERAAFFFNTLSALFVIIMIKDFKLIRFYSLFISLIIITIITNIDDSAKKRIWDETVSQIGFKTEKLNLFSVVHESHYKSAYKMYLDNKIIGIGVRNFRNFCNDERYNEENERSCSTHPHNTYVQILAETGLIGFCFILGLLIYFLYISIYHLKNVIFRRSYYFNNFEICLLASILISIWPLAPTGNFFNNWISIVYYFPIGFFIWSFNKGKKKQIFKL